MESSWYHLHQKWRHLKSTVHVGWCQFNTHYQEYCRKLLSFTNNIQNTRRLYSKKVMQNHLAILMQRMYGINCSIRDVMSSPYPQKIGTVRCLGWILWNLSFRYISLYWSIHTKDDSKRGSAFAFIFGVNWPVQWM